MPCDLGSCAFLCVRFFPRGFENQTFCPVRGSDCATGRRLTKSEEEDTTIINRSGRSTYPKGKSVQTSGATPKVALANPD